MRGTVLEAAGTACAKAQSGRPQLPLCAQRLPGFWEGRAWPCTRRVQAREGQGSLKVTFPAWLFVRLTCPTVAWQGCCRSSTSGFGLCCSVAEKAAARPGENGCFGETADTISRLTHAGPPHPPPPTGLAAAVPCTGVQGWAAWGQPCPFGPQAKARPLPAVLSPGRQLCSWGPQASGAQLTPGRPECPLGVGPVLCGPSVSHCTVLLAVTLCNGDSSGGSKLLSI